MQSSVVRERLKGAWDRFQFWAVHRWLWIASVATTVLGFILAFASSEGTGLLFYLGAILTLVGLGLLLHEARDALRDWQTRLDVASDLEGHIQRNLPDTAYRRWSYFQNRKSSEPEAAIFSEELNARLDGMTNVTKATGRFLIKDRTLQRYAPVLRRRIGGRTNEKKVRLCTEIGSSMGDQTPIELQQAAYFDSVCTNEFSRTKLIRKGKQDRVLLDGQALFLDEGRLLTLDRSQCANHIGVSTLVITSDGRVPLGKQTEDSVGSPGKWAPTGSGSVDYRDLTDLSEGRSSPAFRDLLIHAMQREVEEESNLRACRLMTHIVGYARLLHRGGKPDFFGLSFSTAHSQEVQIKGTEALCMEDYVDHDVAVQTASDHLRRLHDWYTERPDASLILLLNLKFAADFLANTGDGALRPRS